MIQWQNPYKGGGNKCRLCLEKISAYWNIPKIIHSWTIETQKA